VDAAVAPFAVVPALALGSFLNVVIARVPARRSVVNPPSACMSCATPLQWYDNLPLVSYAVLRGRCRHCGARIPLRYPLVEAVTALLVVVSLVVFGVTPLGVLAAAFSAVLVALSAIDLEHRIVPNRIVLPAAVVVLAARTIIDPSPEWALAALGAAAFLLTAALAYPAGMGMGDVKLALLIGAMLGSAVSVAVMLALLTAVAFSVVLFARHGSAARKMAIPFAPFLALGALAGLFAGDSLLDAYLSLF
jgi:leader peptidase (prepilin peptidase)/N-methyltransferase